MHKINGKADGRSYYYSQNGGYLSRQINPGMSQRVKTAPEFANTRRNGKEFGSMGMFAGSIVRSITQRWRFMLDPITTGKLAKELYSLLRTMEGEWGHRDLLLLSKDLIYPLLNKYSKNPLPSGLAEAFESAKIQQIGTAAGTVKINGGAGITFDTVWGDEIKSKGADGAMIMLVALDTVVPTYIAENDSYFMESQPKMRVLKSIDGTFAPSDVLFDGSIETGWPSIATGLPRPMAIGIICLPAKVIGSEMYILQELCSFHCVTPTYTAE